MFKYIKKLTSVVVMFAVIIVFSSSNVYAQEYKQNYNPAHIFFSFAIPLQMGIVSLSLKTLGEDFDVRWEEKNKEKKKEQSLQYYYKNKEAVLEKQRNNPKKKEYKKEWDRKNKEKKNKTKKK